MTTLLELVGDLLRVPEAKADYVADPQGFLDDHGFGDLTADDLNEALAHVVDAVPPAIAVHLDVDAGFDQIAALHADAVDDLEQSGLQDEALPAGDGSDGFGGDVEFDRDPQSTADGHHGDDDVDQDGEHDGVDHDAVVDTIEQGAVDHDDDAGSDAVGFLAHPWDAELDDGQAFTAHDAFDGHSELEFSTTDETQLDVVGESDDILDDVGDFI